MGYSIIDFTFVILFLLFVIFVLVYPVNASIPQTQVTYSSPVYVDPIDILYDERSVIQPQEQETVTLEFLEEDRGFRSKPERFCCEILEEYLGRRVENNIRPDFLRNPRTGRKLEYDVYDPLTKIAIEYNGPFHYNNAVQQERDRIKMELSDKNKIHLIVVPYFVDQGIIDDRLRKEKLRNYILPKLDEILNE